MHSFFAESDDYNILIDTTFAISHSNISVLAGQDLAKTLG
jgi:hypothetical protein